MSFKVGDRVIYKDTVRNGEYLKGEIRDIWKNNSEMITGYFAELDSGEFIHIRPNYNKWSKLED